MRWEALFSDMESQLAAEAVLDLEAEVGELARAELAAVAFSDLIRGGVGQHVALTLRQGVRVEGRVSAAAPEWVLLASGRRSVLVPMGVVVALAGRSRLAAKPSSAVKHTLTSVLRELARNRAVATLRLDLPDGATLRGVLDGVGADFLVLAQLSDGPGRRHGNYSGHTTVALSALLSIGSDAEPEGLP